MLQDGRMMMAEDQMSLGSPPGSTVGGLLRVTRLQHGLGIPDVASALRIRAPYIEAIEEGRAEALPAPAYALGFVRSYAAALGLDAEEVARRYRAEAGAAAGRKPDLAFPAPVPERGIPAGALVVVGTLIAGALYGGWYYVTGTGRQVADLVPALPERLARVETPAAPAPPSASPVQLAPQGQVVLPPVAAGPPVAERLAAPAPVAPAPVPPAPVALPPPPALLPATGAWPTGPAVTAESLSPRPPVASSPTQANAAPVAPAPPPAAVDAIAAFGATGTEESRVLLRARADSWIQVRERANGTVLFNRVLRPGEVYRVPARGGLLLTTGNAGGLEVVLDGDALPNLGANGAVRRDLPMEPDQLRQAVAAAPR